LLETELRRCKIDGASGRELWRRVIVVSMIYAFAVRLDDAGNVIAGGRDYNGRPLCLFVVKLAGLNGSRLWSRSITGRRGRDQVSARRSTPRAMSLRRE